MGRAGEGAERRFAVAEHAPVLVGVALMIAAGTEATARGGPAREAARILFAAAVTVPPIFLGPYVAALAVTAATLLSLTVPGSLTVAGVAVQLGVLYRLAHDGRRRELAQGLALALALPLLVAALLGAGTAESHPGAAPVGADYFSSETALLTLLLGALAPATACAAIARRARDDARVHRAARQAVAGDLLEHMARGERARIARELHDVVAHHISMIAVQAETARLTTPGMPPAGAQRLLDIGDTARAGLTEMRRLLGVLREDSGVDGQAPVAERRPQPGLAQLNELLDEARDASGAGTRLIVSGHPIALDPGVELAAYRIVQEALTNARRHAPGAAVDVELHYADDLLWLRVRDNGPGPPPVEQDGGHGLLGMRERAAAVGGEFRSGAATAGGFVVEAALPAKAEALG